MQTVIFTNKITHKIQINAQRLPIGTMDSCPVFSKRFYCLLHTCKQRHKDNTMWKYKSSYKKRKKKSCISKKASHDKRNKFIYLTNVLNYVLSVVTMFSLSFIDRLFCCCFCPVIGIFQMTFQNTFTSHIISKHSVFLLFVYAICIWSVPSSYYLCGPHLVCAWCKMMQTAKQWVRPS